MFRFIPRAQNESTSHIKANESSRFRCEVEKFPTFAFESNVYTFLTYKYNTSAKMWLTFTVDNSRSYFSLGNTLTVKGNYHQLVTKNTKLLQGRQTEVFFYSFL